MDPKPEPGGFAPNKDGPDPAPVEVEVEGFGVPNPGNEVVLVDVPNAPGLVDVAPPKKDPVPVVVAVAIGVVPFALEVPNPPRAGGFFLTDPDNPSTAG